MYEEPQLFESSQHQLPGAWESKPSDDSSPHLQAIPADAKWGKDELFLLSLAQTTDSWAILMWLLLQASKFWDGLFCSYLSWNNGQNEGLNILLYTSLLFSLSTSINAKPILLHSRAELCLPQFFFLSYASSGQSEYSIILISIKSQNWAIFHHSLCHQDIIIFLSQPWLPSG